MPPCATCHKTIVFGGVKDRARGVRYCNKRCAATGADYEAAARILADDIAAHVRQTHAGPCPACRGAGPVDIHRSHSVWSIIVLTSWKSTGHLVCRACARKRQALDAVGSGLLGWWGFPFGLIITPIQIARNIAGLFTGPDPSTPSAALEGVIRDTMVRQFIADANRAPPTATPIAAAP
jgi:hypothetical protein